MRRINVQSRLAEIHRIAERGDDELAHREEKKLWQDVLQELAKLHPLAAEALESGKIRFRRHYA